MAKPSVLPLYEVFNAIDKKDYRWYKSLSKEKQKAFSPYLQLKYSASATGSADATTKPTTEPTTKPAAKSTAKSTATGSWT